METKLVAWLILIAITLGIVMAMPMTAQAKTVPITVAGLYAALKRSCP
ncbi:MAG TPA: hypothetical protein H9875_02245 [Candidatus Levilactobacillus faecigallinarum]|uniref:Uncharacterized protein n=1 Tax=Candidatus Levilactobacillus faecigallinarum TaxID=2838638 RepID=A0A9D1U4I3_9LACO|nr:hypothetical protein [Candidatus Levilactobacillus faecigallinarum]